MGLTKVTDSRLSREFACRSSGWTRVMDPAGAGGNAHDCKVVGLPYRPPFPAVQSSAIIRRSLTFRGDQCDDMIRYRPARASVNYYRRRYAVSRVRYLGVPLIPRVNDDGSVDLTPRNAQFHYPAGVERQPSAFRCPPAFSHASLHADFMALSFYK